MITLKGAEVSAKIKEQVLAMNGKLGGYVPTAAIVRIGERPDDLSYERNVMKRIAAYGMETKSYVYPADITEEESLRSSRRSMMTRPSTEFCYFARCRSISMKNVRSR